jgi:hypothetical protein
MQLDIGDRVEWQSAFTAYVFHGVIEGFYGKDRDVAFCTDQTGRGSRPVSVRRLSLVSEKRRHSGRAA